jgi:hypothetical protein
VLKSSKIRSDSVISESYQELGLISRRGCDIEDAFLDGEVIAADETGRLALERDAVGRRTHPTASCSLYASWQRLATAAARSVITGCYSVS